MAQLFFNLGIDVKFDPNWPTHVIATRPYLQISNPFIATIIPLVKRVICYLFLGR